MIRIITVVKLTETFMEEEVLIARLAWECAIVCACVRERGQRERGERESKQTGQRFRGLSKFVVFFSPFYVSTKRFLTKKGGSFNKRVSTKVRTETAALFRVYFLFFSKSSRIIWCLQFTPIIGQALFFFLLNFLLYFLGDSRWT